MIYEVIYKSLTPHHKDQIYIFTHKEAKSLEQAKQKAYNHFMVNLPIWVYDMKAEARELECKE